MHELAHEGGAHRNFVVKLGIGHFAFFAFFAFELQDHAMQNVPCTSSSRSSKFLPEIGVS